MARMRAPAAARLIAARTAPFKPWPARALARAALHVGALHKGFLVTQARYAALFTPGGSACDCSAAAGQLQLSELSSVKFNSGTRQGPAAAVWESEGACSEPQWHTSTARAVPACFHFHVRRDTVWLVSHALTSGAPGMQRAAQGGVSAPQCCRTHMRSISANLRPRSKPGDAALVHCKAKTFDALMSTSLRRFV